MISKGKSWVTVQEVASLLSLSVEMIYKLVREGNLPAVQIGSSIRIDAQELNQWLKSKKVFAKQTSFPPQISKVLKSFQKKIKAQYGRQFLAIYIYGSTARNEANAESDVDSLIILKDLRDRWRELKKIQKIAYDVSFGAGISVVLSVTVVSESDWATRQDPLLQRIREEGKRAA